jgi:outer membrane receptor protein involved in Fe transport
MTAPLSGYWLFNATAEYKVTKNFVLFGKVDNIFDVRYNTFGVYGQANDVLGNRYNDGRFVRLVPSSRLDRHSLNALRYSS